MEKTYQENSKEIENKYSTALSKEEKKNVKQQATIQKLEKEGKMWVILLISK